MCALERLERISSHDAWAVSVECVSQCFASHFECELWKLYRQTGMNCVERHDTRDTISSSHFVFSKCILHSATPSVPHSILNEYELIIPYVWHSWTHFYLFCFCWFVCLMHSFNVVHIFQTGNTTMVWVCGNGTKRFEAKEIDREKIYKEDERFDFDVLHKCGISAAWWRGQCADGWCWCSIIITYYEYLRRNEAKCETRENIEFENTNATGINVN